MQLDRPHIAIRTRTISEIGDLSLVLMRRYAGGIATAWLIGALPWIVLNAVLLVPPVAMGWHNDLVLESASLGMVRYAVWMVILVALQTPVAGCVLTMYLGTAVFEPQPTVGSMVAKTWSMWRPILWSLVGMRMVLLSTLWVAVRMTTPMDFIDGMVAGGLVLIAGIQRSGRPFLPEILLLEECPIRRRDSAGQNVRQRSRLLHRPHGAELNGRFIAVVSTLAVLAVAFGLAMRAALMLLIGGGVAVDLLSWFVVFPAVLWLTGAISVVIRLLNYLDCRIRLEGWDVELAVRAETIRQFGDDTHAVRATPPRSVGAVVRIVATALLIAAAVATPASAEVRPSDGAHQVDPPTSVVTTMPRHSNWFDASRASSIPVQLEDNRPSAKNRDSRWTPEKPVKTKTAKPAAAARDWSWLQIVGCVLAIAIVMAIAAALSHLISRYQPAPDSGAMQSLISGAPDEQTIRRMGELPAAVRRSDVNLREETTRLAAEGHYDQAVVLLFGHQLLALDRGGLLRLGRGKTNLQYVEEVHQRDPVSAPELAATTEIFDRSYFGQHHVRQAEFEQLWQNNLSLERRLLDRETLAPAAASATPSTAVVTAGAALLLMIMVGGCSRLTTTYGDTRGRTAQRSLNGLETFRRALLSNLGDASMGRLEPIDIQLLKDSTLDIDVIVWTPRQHQAIDPATRTWLRRWLRQGHRTLVYVVADEGSLTPYLRQMRPQAPAEQRLVYRRRLAHRLVERMRRSHRRPEDDDWFTASPVEVGGVGGYAIEPPVQPPETDDSILAQTMFEFDRGGQSDDWQPRLIAELTRDRWNGSAVVVVGGGSLVTNFAFAESSSAPSQMHEQSQMQEPSQRQKLSHASAIVSSISESIARRVQHAPATPPGVGHDAVATGTEPESPRPIKIAFATTDTARMPVRQTPPPREVSSGMAVLTTWPLSLVTVHGLVAGLIACLILLPIFGRPRALPAPNPNRFVHHIDAVATLMQRGGGEAFARDRIERYRKRKNLPRQHPTRPPNSASSADPSLRQVAHKGITKPVAGPAGGSDPY